MADGKRRARLFKECWVPTDIPPFYGSVETTMNALRLIHAARQGVIPRITRRLNDSERRTMIKSGAVFVFSVEESGIKRWTDGLLWSPSRIVGNFLVYREILDRANSRGSHKKLYPTDEPSRTMTAEQGTFKPNGLIKKTITVTIEGSDLHLISYYTSSDQHSGKLKRPTSRADIMSLPMDPRLFRSTNFRVPPKVEKGPDGASRLVETEEVTDVVECKVEDEPYNISMSPTSWGSDASSQGSPVEHSFGSASASFGCSVSSYPRQGDSRWVMGSAPVLRPDTWPSHSSHHYSSRRDTTHSDSWGSLSSARWPAEPYHHSPSPPASSVYVDRSRNRTTPYPLQIPSAHRRDNDGLNTRYAGHTVGETRSDGRNLPWLLAGGTETDTKDNIRAQHSASPFAATNNSHQPIYTPQGYIRPHSHSHSHSYSSGGWSSGSSAGSLVLASPQAGAPFSPAASGMHSPYGSTYTPSSGGISSPEEYSNAEEYADS
ncbi:Gti1/Pac2 family-domain-containing protein [Roridomyces roridus]|uniref:Gti1/Pac2 family-domain-containing protein n=1 Tax=Roridomyces roridus TaxID=1738132 RepID=A0AAD7CK14_9AGAR|nr:Gti1/Pac2 family-domain-containing protein [Roridomyces roridus]